MSFLWQGAAFRKRSDALSDGPAESGGSSQGLMPAKQGPGNRKEEARGSGASQSRTHFPSRVRRNRKPPGGRFRERTTDEVRFNGHPIGNRLSMSQDGDERIPPGNRSPAARQGSGTRRNRNRNSNIPAKEPEGPTGAARPRPEPPWESQDRLRAERTDLGTVEAGGNAGLHFVWGPCRIARTAPRSRHFPRHPELVSGSRPPPALPLPTWML